MPDTHSNTEELEKPILEVEHYIHVKHRIRELKSIFEPMTEADNRPLTDFSVQSQVDSQSSILPHVIQTNTFKLKLSLVKIMQHNQFYGNPT